MQAFEINTIQQNQHIAIIGNKSNNILLKTLLKHIQDLGASSGLVIVKNKDNESFYSTFFPSCFIHTKIDDNVENMIKRQKIIIEKTGFQDNVVIILDNLMCQQIKIFSSLGITCIYVGHDFLPEYNSLFEYVFVSNVDNNQKYTVINKKEEKFYYEPMNDDELIKYVYGSTKFKMFNNSNLPKFKMFNNSNLPKFKMFNNSNLTKFKMFSHNNLKSQ